MTVLLARLSSWAIRRRRPAVGVHQRPEGLGLLDGLEVLAQAVLHQLLLEDLRGRARAPRRPLAGSPARRSWPPAIAARRPGSGICPAPGSTARGSAGAGRGRSGSWPGRSSDSASNCWRGWVGSRRGFPGRMILASRCALTPSCLLGPVVAPVLPGEAAAPGPPLPLRPPSTRPCATRGDPATCRSRLAIRRPSAAGRRRPRPGRAARRRARPSPWPGRPWACSG